MRALAAMVRKRTAFSILGWAGMIFFIGCRGHLASLSIVCIVLFGGKFMYYPCLKISKGIYDRIFPMQSCFFYPLLLEGRNGSHGKKIVVEKFFFSLSWDGKICPEGT